MKIVMWLMFLLTMPIAVLLAEDEVLEVGNGIGWLEGLIGAGLLATIWVIVKVINVVESAIAEILNIIGKDIDPDSTPGKILKYARKILDWLANNVPHK